MPPGRSEEAEGTPEERRALFRVVRGEPTDTEIAALTVVLAAVSATAAGPAPEAASTPRSVWNDPVARLRTSLPVGPGAWRALTWPR